MDATTKTTAVETVTRTVAVGLAYGWLTACALSGFTLQYLPYTDGACGWLEDEIAGCWRVVRNQ
jgi:hypothetical protein